MAINYLNPQRRNTHLEIGVRKLQKVMRRVRKNAALFWGGRPRTANRVAIASRIVRGPKFGLQTT